MKAYLKFALGLCTVAALTACSNEEPANGDNVIAKGKAYLNVCISGAPEVSRSSNLGDYVDGSDAEHAVSNAYFYFFSSEGAYMTTSNIWTGGNNSTDENIEYYGNNVVVLENLAEGDAYPAYVFTVLNKPDGFTPSSTLAETAAQILNWSNDAENFVMTTSAYYNGSTLIQATPLTKDMFTSSFDEESGEVVDIYVERTVAKVSFASEKNLYPIDITVGGNSNDQIGESNEAATKLAIKIKGWNLNYTANQTYYGKQIGQWTSSFDASTPFANWNKASYFRSFWAESALWGVVDDSKFNPAVTLNDLTLTTSDVAYCFENTNDPYYFTENNSKKLIDVIPSAVTSVTIHAQIVDAEGNELGNMVSYGGVIYKEEAFLNLVLNIAKAQGNLNLWTNDGSTYTQINTDYVALEGIEGDIAKVKAVVNTEADFSNLYTKNSEGKFVEITADDAKTLLTADLASAQPDNFDAQGFNNGDCYYEVPIEHNFTRTITDKDAFELNVADYGVVRNHWYQLNITSVSKVGNAVFDPDEEIVNDEPQDPTYYLTAKVNILSWRIVNQDVEI